MIRRIFMWLLNLWRTTLSRRRRLPSTSGSDELQSMSVYVNGRPLVPGRDYTRRGEGNLAFLCQIDASSILEETYVYVNGLLMMPGEDYVLEKGRLTFLFQIKENDIIQVQQGPPRQVFLGRDVRIHVTADNEVRSEFEMGTPPSPKLKNPVSWNPPKTSWERLLEE